MAGLLDGFIPDARQQAGLLAGLDPVANPPPNFPLTRRQALQNLLPWYLQEPTDEEWRATHRDFEQAEREGAPRKVKPYPGLSSEERGALLAADLGTTLPAGWLKAAAGIPLGIARRLAAKTPQKVAAPAIRNPSAPLFDYSRLAEVPAVPQVNLPRAEPARGVPQAIVDAMTNKENIEKANAAVERGLKQGAAGWSNAMPLRDAFEEELGSRPGRKSFDLFADLTGATSADSKVFHNIRTASYFKHLIDQGMPLPVRLKKPETGNWHVPPGEIPYPYGSRAQALHVQNVENVVSGRGMDPLVNPKPPSFSANLKGNYEPVMVDRHNRRLWNLPGTPTQGYGYIEGVQQDLARKMGIAPAQYQSGGFVGAAHETNQMSGSDPFLKIFEDRLALTAEHHGLTKPQAFRQFLRGELKLLSGAGLVGAPMLYPSQDDSASNAAAY